MSSDGSNFYSIEFWVSSKSIVCRGFKRALDTETLDLQLEAQDALFSLFWKHVLGFLLNTMWIRFETLITWYA